MLGLASRIVASNEWPEFRGPTGQGISTATNVPIHWSATSNILWKTEIPGRGWSSPVLSQERAYLTTAVTEAAKATTRLHALCVDAKEGRTLWNIPVFEPGQDATREFNQKNSLASPTPVVHGNRLYIHFGHLGTAALDLSGKVLWRQTDLKYPSVHGNGGSPVLVEDMLVFSCDGAEDPFIVALDTNTGKVRWKTPRRTVANNKFSFSTPLHLEIQGQKQIISPGSGLVAAYTPTDGRELWRVRHGNGYSVVPRPVFAQGLLFVCTGFDAPKLLAIKPIGARGDVTATHVAWSLAKGAPLTPSPLAVGEELYFVNDSGIASCVEVRTGKVHWQERLGGGFSASPVFAEGRIYFQNETGLGFVVKQSRDFTLLARNNLGERTLASYAVADHALLIRSESHLWWVGKP